MFCAAATLLDRLLDDADSLSPGPAAATGLRRTAEAQQPKLRSYALATYLQEAGQLSKLSFGLPENYRHGLSAAMKGTQSWAPLAAYEALPAFGESMPRPEAPIARLAMRSAKDDRRYVVTFGVK